MSQMSEFQSLIDEYQSKISMYQEEVARINEAIAFYRKQEAEIFAQKKWTRSDISDVLSQQGYEPTEELISEIIAQGDWEALSEKTQEEIEIFKNQVLQVLQEMEIDDPYEK